MDIVPLVPEITLQVKDKIKNTRGAFLLSVTYKDALSKHCKH